MFTYFSDKIKLTIFAFQKKTVDLFQHYKAQEIINKF